MSCTEHTVLCTKFGKMKESFLKHHLFGNKPGHWKPQNGDRNSEVEESHVITED